MLDREPSPFETSDVEPAEASAPRLESSSRGAPGASHAPGMASPPPQPNEWRGNDDATDFLGLDQEVNTVAVGHDWNGASTATQPDAGAHTSVAETHVLPDGSNSWLLSLDDARAGAPGHQPVAPIREAAGATEETEPASALDTSWTDAAPKKSGLTKIMVRFVAAAAVLALCVSIYQTYRAPRHTEPWAKPIAPSQKSEPAQDELADPTASESSGRSDARTGQKLQPTKAPSTAAFDEHASGDDSDARTAAATAGSTSDTNTQPEPLPSSGDADSARDADASVHSDGLATGGEPSTSSDTEGFPATWPVSVTGGADPASSTSDIAGPESRTASGSGANQDEGPFGPDSAFANRSPLTAADSNPSVGPERDPSQVAAPGSFSVAELEAATREGRTLDIKPEAMAAARASKNGLRAATPQDLAGVWEGSTVPMDAIDQPNRILTPNVGRVRILLKGREIFEGRLYAIGQGKVWIDTELGRMALFSEMLRKIEQLSSPDGTPVLGDRGSQELAGLPRVRVRSLGGVFFGKIIAQDETSLTMITDEGARITLESTDFEPAPKGSVVVVKRKL